LAGRADALEGAGYGVQVPILEGGVNLFLEGPSGRERVYRDGEHFRLRHSDAHVTAADIDERTSEDPSVLSPNVLLRPVVESHVFPTVAYVAGPGELAYFAQLQPLFEAHGVAMPVVVPRLGATAVETKVGKVLDKYGLDVAALDRPFHDLAGDFARDEVPDGVRRALGALRGAVARGTEELAEAASQVDPTLKGPVQHVRSVAFDAVGEAEKKIVQAVKRESEIALRQIEKARLHLFPDGKPQERVLNPFYYVARYGDDFVTGVSDAFAAALPDLGGGQ
jgi:bacillithiol biosynthesis cysteine-adding enzyme BshC